MKWINVNESYLDYLRNVERRIPKTDYGKDRYKPFSAYTRLIFYSISFVMGNTSETLNSPMSTLCIISKPGIRY